MVTSRRVVATGQRRWRRPSALVRARALAKLETGIRFAGTVAEARQELTSRPCCREAGSCTQTPGFPGRSREHRLELVESGILRKVLLCVVARVLPHPCPKAC